MPEPDEPSGPPEDSTEAEKERPGLPRKESRVSEKPFVSPKGKRYRIIKTDEKDAYDEPVPGSPDSQ
jgi:hypothetical protein